MNWWASWNADKFLKGTSVKRSVLLDFYMLLVLKPSSTSAREWSGEVAYRAIGTCHNPNNQSTFRNEGVCLWERITERPSSAVPQTCSPCQPAQELREGSSSQTSAASACSRRFCLGKRWTSLACVSENNACGILVRVGTGFPPSRSIFSSSTLTRGKELFYRTALLCMLLLPALTKQSNLNMEYEIRSSVKNQGLILQFNFN